LPFVMGVLADLSGKPTEPLPPVADRKFLDIDVDNFDSRMKALKPRVAFQVPNTLTGEGNLNVELTFDSMDDFSPAAVASKVDALNKLLEARKQLANLITYMDGKSGAEDLVAKLLPVVDDLERALKADTAGEAAEAYRRGVELIHRQLLETLRKRGVIVNVVGNAADTHDPEYICGVAGNAALAAFTQSLGSVSAKDGIRVVAINPGPVATDRLITLMKRKARDRTGSEDNWKELFKPLPFGRGATPEEIGAAIAFIASDRSGYTSGSVVTIDAGLSARAQAF